MQDAVGSCLSASVSRIGEGIEASVKNLTQPLVASLADTVIEHLKVSCSIVCSLVDVDDYLNVSPNEIQWITDDIGVFFNVESNVDWEVIVTS